MRHRDDHLALDDAALLAECDVHVHRASGPGGQHRNKVSSAVRLRHRSTGVTATASESRSQHDNRRTALRRLRMNLACRLRQPVCHEPLDIPPAIGDCLFAPRAGRAEGPRKIRVGKRDDRFWPVAAFLLDLLDSADGRLSRAAGLLGVTTGSLAAVLRSERHLLAAAQQIRRRHGLKPLR